VQQALKVQVDGFFGAKTEQAVKEFQTAQSLEADGIVGPRTRAKLIPTEKSEAENKESPSCRRQNMASWWLARGAVGDSVKEIQQTLGVPVDGVFGPRTEHAVKEFQTAHSLDADGIVGPRTRAEIARVQTEKKEAVPAPHQVPSPVVPSAPQEAVPAPQAVPIQSLAMTHLINMGFPDVNLNAELLKKHKGDVVRVIAEFLGE
jgi:peptidoglycan hydrolase-like protein with peptidoglycan-binding domain